MKRLVVFYSFGGNTRAIARRIAKNLNADIAEIRTIKAYPDDYDVLLGLGKREVESGYIPLLYPLACNAQEYDTIIIGTPVWWYSYAPAVKSFLKSIKWTGKRVYTFATNGGALGHTPSDFKRALRGSAVAPTFGIKFKDKQLLTPESEIDDWTFKIR